MTRQPHCIGVPLAAPRRLPGLTSISPPPDRVSGYAPRSPSGPGRRPPFLRSSVDLLPRFELLNQVFRGGADALAGGLRQADLGLGHRLLVAAQRGIAAGEADMDRPDVGVALGIELEDLEGLFGL